MCETGSECYNGQEPYRGGRSRSSHQPRVDPSVCLALVEDLQASDLAWARLPCSYDKRLQALLALFLMLKTDNSFAGGMA